MDYRIELIWSRAYQPTDKAEVERAQATTDNWADFASCFDSIALLQKLARVTATQREHYLDRRLNEQTRQQVYLNVETPLRSF